MTTNITQREAQARFPEMYGSVVGLRKQCQQNPNTQTINVTGLSEKRQGSIHRDLEVKVEALKAIKKDIENTLNGKKKVFQKLGKRCQEFAGHPEVRRTVRATRDDQIAVGQRGLQLERDIAILNVLIQKAEEPMKVLKPRVQVNPSWVFSKFGFVASILAALGILAATNDVRPALEAGASIASEVYQGFRAYTG